MDIERLAAVEREVAVLRARVDGLDGRYVELSKDLKALAIDLQRMWRDLVSNNNRQLLAALVAAVGGLGSLTAILLQHML